MTEATENQAPDPAHWTRSMSATRDSDDPYYGVMRLATGADSMAALREMFPEGKADDLNFCLFSTSGVHGTYCTIEDAEAGEVSDVTFVVVQPRIVGIRYGNCEPRTPEDFAFLKTLRESSRQAVATIGGQAEPAAVQAPEGEHEPQRCECNARSESECEFCAHRRQWGLTDAQAEQAAAPAVSFKGGERAELIDALEDALSVCSSVDRSKSRTVDRGGCTMHLQTAEWCNWLADEVAPKVQKALAALAAQPQPADDIPTTTIPPDPEGMARDAQRFGLAAQPADNNSMGEARCYPPAERGDERAGWHFARLQPSGTISATAPDGRLFVVPRGRMDSTAGDALLNAMTADLTKPKTQPKGTEPLTETREYKHAMGDWLGAVGELIEAMGRPKFEADTPVAVIAEAIREAAKRLVPASAPEVAPWPITDAMIDAVAPYCQAKSRDLAHTALAAARNAAPVKQAPAPAPVADRREFEVHAAERGFELERYPEGPYVSFHTDKHWQTWRAAQAAIPSPAVKAEPLSEQQIADIVGSFGMSFWAYMATEQDRIVKVARGVERAHGIGVSKPPVQGIQP